MKLKILNRNTLLSARIFIVLVVLLLLFGKTFSKIPIIGSLYLHDFLLLFATFTAFLSISLKFKFPSVFLLIVISISYLFYSVFFLDIKADKFIMIFRHYFIFLYLICCYIIANKFFINKKKINQAITFIIKISKVAVIFQLIYTTYLFIVVPNYSPFSDFSYFSPLGIMGIITYAAYIIVYAKKSQRLYHFLFVLFLSMMLGHSSAFLAVFIILMVDFYISFAPRQRLITLIIVVISVTLLFFLPQFNDVNVSWRLLYWQHILEQVFIDKFMLLGHGFGTPFMTKEFAWEIEKVTGSRFMIYALDARWVNPPHNSFFTMMFHIGFLPFLLLLKPLKSITLQLFIQPKTNDKDKLFLMYAVIGEMVWSSFNVILELPHSAIYFWLIYFTYIFNESTKK